jgi:hypothetical protein
MNGNMFCYKSCFHGTSQNCIILSLFTKSRLNLNSPRTFTVTSVQVLYNLISSSWKRSKKIRIIPVSVAQPSKSDADQVCISLQGYVDDLSLNDGSLWRDIFLVRTETNRDSICSGASSVCFTKPITIFFGLFRHFGPVLKQQKQTDMFRNKPKKYIRNKKKLEGKYYSTPKIKSGNTVQ